MLHDEHPGEKVLVFTEYADTAIYVAEALKDAGIPNVGLAFGDSENPAELARRFSPESNRLPGEEAANTRRSRNRSTYSWLLMSSPKVRTSKTHTSLSTMTCLGQSSALFSALAGSIGSGKSPTKSSFT